MIVSAAFSDANCTDPLTEKIVTMNPTQEGIVPEQPGDFTLYGKFYDASGNPGSCERHPRGDRFKTKNRFRFGCYL